MYRQHVDITVLLSKQQQQQQQPDAASRFARCVAAPRSSAQLLAYTYIR